MHTYKPSIGTKILPPAELGILGKHLLAGVLIAPVFYLASYSSLGYIFTLFVTIVSIGALLVPFRGFIVWMYVIILSDDFSVTRDASDLTTIFTSLPFGISLAALISLWCLVVCLFFMSQGQRLRLSRFDILVWAFFGWYAVGVVIGLPNLIDSGRQYVSDLSLALLFISTYVYLRLFADRSERAYELACVFVALIAARALWVVPLFLLGMGYEVGANVKVTLDSTRNLFQLGIVFGLAFFVVNGIRRQGAGMAMTLVLTCAFALITYASRGNFVLLALALCILGVTLSWKRRLGWGVKRFFGILGAAAIAVVTTLGAMELIREGSTDFVLWKMSTFMPKITRTGAPGSAGVRLYELLNIVQHGLQNGGLFWGQGMGSAVSEKYVPYMDRIVDKAGAYPLEWYAEQHFFKPHGTLLYILMKLGVIGLVLWIGFSLRLIFAATGRVWNGGSPAYTVMLASFVSIFPVFVLKGFSTKLQILFGIATAISIALMEQRNDSKKCVQPGKHR